MNEPLGFVCEGKTFCYFKLFNLFVQHQQQSPQAALFTCDLLLCVFWVMSIPTALY